MSMLGVAPLKQAMLFSPEPDHWPTTLRPSIYAFNGSNA
jgi:hypothetical protein